jgi:hypothetical protein
VLLPAARSGSGWTASYLLIALVESETTGYNATLLRVTGRLEHESTVLHHP